MNRIFLGLGIGAVSIALAGVVQEGAIAYMVANPDRDRPTFGLVSNGSYSIFIKPYQGQYDFSEDFSEDFSLNRRQNELYGILQGLNRLKML